MWYRQDLNLRPTDSETATSTAQPPHFVNCAQYTEIFKTTEVSHDKELAVSCEVEERSPILPLSVIQPKEDTVFTFVIFVKASKGIFYDIFWVGTI